MLFGIPLLALHKISARLGLDSAVFGPELSLGKSGRDRTGGEVVACPWRDLLGSNFTSSRGTAESKSCF